MNINGRLVEEKRKYVIVLLALVWAFNASFVYHGAIHFLLDVAVLMCLIDMFGAIKLDVTDLFLFLGVCFFFYNQDKDVANACMTAGVIWVEYLIGKGIGKTIIKEDEKCMPLCLGVVSLILAIKGLLTYSWLFKNEYNGIFPMWGTGILLPRTQHEYFLIMMTTSLAFWIIYIKKNKWSLIGVVISMLTLALSLYGLGRMSMCATLVVIVLVCFLCLAEKKFQINYKIVLISICIMLIGVILVICRKGIVFKLLTIRDWSTDGGILGNIRFTLWIEALKLILQYPMGSSHIVIIPYEGRIEGFAHNTWIDIGRTGGVIPFVLMVIFTVIVCIRLVQIWKREKCVEKYALIAVFIGMTLYCMFEPVLNANPYFFCGEVFLSGMVMGGYNAIRKR